MTADARLRRVNPLAPTVCAAVIGLVISVCAWLSVSATDERLALQVFNENATNNERTLESGIDRYFHNLVALGALFDSTKNDVTREEFDSFSKTLLKGQTAILGLSWIPRVTRDQRATYEITARQDGIADYHIRNVAADGSLSIAPEQDEYFPIYYSSKETPDSELYGFNLRDNNGPRQRMLDTARDENRIVASQTLLVRSGPGDRRGFLVVLPIYRYGTPVSTLGDRRQNLEGFVLGIFQVGAMVDAILADVMPPLDIFLFEPDALPSDMPIYVHSSRIRSVPAVPMSLQALTAAPHWSGGLSANGRQWKLIVPRPPRLLIRSHDRAWFVFGVCLLITGLVVAYMWKSVRYAHRLNELARTDSLTSLANRRVFEERLDIAFAASRRNGNLFAVHFIDLDGFKDVNDTLGHATGDLLLRAVVARLAKLVRETDVLARFGGDEFAVLQADANDPQSTATLAQTIISAMAVPFVIAGNDIYVTASVGIAPYVADIPAAGAMMIQADRALYRAKDDGANCFRSHSRELDQQVRLWTTLAEELRAGVERNELELYYQPQVEIGSGRILGLEALVRWNHPKRGLLMPSIFIPVAEKSAIIQRLGQWVFEAACAQLAQWVKQGIAPQTTAVNVSGLQLKRIDDFERDVTGSLAKWNIAPGAVELELTETVLMEASPKLSDALQRLRQMGVRIAIDDFGTGFSSLRYLTVYPVNRLKIAQELVFGVTDDPRNATVVRAAIRLAHELGIEAIAEGVETEAQARFLSSAGCDNAQGYLYSRPVDAIAATALLLRSRIGPVMEPMQIRDLRRREGL
jgi:diguanylate cyclase (GGDEF)-like protein